MDKASETAVVHPFAPVWNANSEVLILGSFPSVRSREEGFYYGHPRNRFWTVLSRIYGEETGVSAEEKTAFLLRHRLALWDTVQSCVLRGSSDASVRSAVPNDIASLVRGTRITRVYCNGRLAQRLYEQYAQAACGISAVPLPSTSPANAAWSPERLCEAWRVIAQD